jgi:leucine--tRNA ligase
MQRYNPTEIEQKWQNFWRDQRTYEIDINDPAPKKYVAGMFPYPSGAGLHVGHVRNYAIVDVIARYQRAQGFKVLNPMGWDTFGLPAENYAIKTGIAPAEVTAQNITNFKQQLSKLGISYDWSKEINTSDPAYYKWTQWIFTELFKRGLAYQKESYQWWDPVDKTVLANEQIINGHAERSGAKVEKRLMKQWFFKITAYADQLLEGLDQLDWPDKIKAMQRNWIGRSEGAQVKFAIDGQEDQDIVVFTTRPDTLFGVGFITLAPENPLVLELTTPEQRATVEAYVEQSLLTSEVERMMDDKEKTGVFTGLYALHPLTGERLPIWVADYVLGSYGYGAVMGVPGHDQRDYDFAKKFNLPIIPVVQAPLDHLEAVYDGEGTLVNSGEFSGLPNTEGGQAITARLTELGRGQTEVTYKMRDWLISRQRYWGAPIPIAYDEQGQAHAIPAEQLPVILPEVADYKPDGSGRGVLARSTDWLQVEVNGQMMTRETDTMDGYACSSWYLLRYLDPHNTESAWNSDQANHWLPVDFYCGGDHAVAHLLYVRFWTRVFYDMGLVNFQEPIQHLVYNGYINAPDGSKMSKSKGNTVDPLELIDQGYGADALRVYELFIGPYELDASWDPRGIVGTYRFLARIWTLVQEFKQSETRPGVNSALDKALHQAISKVKYHLDNLGFNTAVAALMELVNDLYKLKADGFVGDWQGALEQLAQMLEPFAPHLANELWQELTGRTDLDGQVFPQFDPNKLQADQITVVVQVNGKLRAKITVAPEIAEAEVIKLALEQDNVRSFTDGHEILKTIYVPKKLVSIVVK